MTEKTRAVHKSTAHLLADWRAAERDTEAAKNAAAIAALAVKAAQAAAEASSEASTAADAAHEAARTAQNAANAARRAAADVAEASEIATVQADGDQARANPALAKAQRAERQSHEGRFQSATQAESPQAPS